MKHNAVAIDVTSVGLITSVGHDALTACAAIRAGVSRPAPITGSKTLELATAKTVEATGHPVTPVTDGFVGTARWTQLAARAFEDLVRQGQLPSASDRAFWSTTAVQVLVADIDSERFQLDRRAGSAVIDDTFLRPLLRRLPPSLQPQNVLIQPVERLGLALVVEGYREMLTAMRAERVIVLAVDSYVCPFTLDWLGEHGRLKGDLNPVGLSPGEAAAAILLEPARAGAHRERPTWAQIVDVATAQDAALDDEAADSRGRVLATVLAALVDADTGDLHLDLNGEVWRAREYGNALVHLAPRGIGHARLHHVAAEIGDTGSAALTVSTIAAIRALHRGYARSIRVAVAATTETGEIGGIALRRAERS